MNQYPNDPTTGHQPYQGGQTPPPPVYPQQGYPGQPQFTPQPGYPPGYPQQPQQPGYPQQPMPMQQPTKKGKKALWITLGCIASAIVLCGVIANAGKSSTGTKVADNGSSTTKSTTDIGNSSQPPSQPSQQHYKVGDTVNVGDTWEITVNSVKVDTGGQYSFLKDGYVYLLIDVSLKNIAQEQKSLYGTADWNLKGADGQKYDSTIFSDSPPAPDGKVEPGDPAKGVLAYQVLSTAKDFRLAFEISYFSSKQVIWDLSAS